MFDPPAKDDFRSKSAWLRKLLFAAGIVGGALTILAVAGMRAQRRRLGEQTRRVRLGPSWQTHPFSSIARALVGHSKSEIADALGQPPTAAFTQSRRNSHTGTFWDADTWYYPVSQADRCAMAIIFWGGRARRVERVYTPIGSI